MPLPSPPSIMTRRSAGQGPAVTFPARHPSHTRPPRECIHMSRWPPLHVRTRKNVLCGTPTRFGDINLPGLAQFWTQHSAGRFSPSAGARTRPSHVFHAVEGSRFSTLVAGRRRTKIRTSRMPYQLPPARWPEAARSRPSLTAPISHRCGYYRTNVTSVRRVGRLLRSAAMLRGLMRRQWRGRHSLRR